MTTLPGEPIFISSDLVRFTGGITEAILLSCFTAWAEDDGEEWFTKTTVEIQEATALSPHQIIEARRNLRQREFIEEARRGLPARLFYRINPDAFIQPRLPIASPQYRKQQIPAELRAAVLERDGFTCQRCGAGKHLQADHIIPESKGGLTASENMQALCRTCNQQKGAQA